MINILFCGNEKVYNGILLCLMSMVKHTNVCVNVYILTANLKDLHPDYTPINNQQKNQLENILKNKNPNSKVEIITLGKEFKNWILSSKNKFSTYTPFAFLRLFADIVELPNKIIYLDADIMINGDITSLFNVDITNYELGVIKDRYGKFFIKPNYFNSGVLLMNMDNIKKSQLLNKVRHLCQTKKMAFPDQSALNKCCKSKLYLPRKFNEQGNLRNNTLIQHFSKRIKWFPFKTLNVKPYQIDEVHNIYKIHNYDDIYNEFIKLQLK